ncbi:type II toxin-antitoxin system Phd/YefM family antitoxin [Acidisphaera sp. S103]|nr:type II toxin-antitoxin system Phd/YefM family antitoxin [Acidisphaera sp. S103]
MRTMSATEAKQNMGALLDTAQSEPVTIQGNRAKEYVTNG